MKQTPNDILEISGLGGEKTLEGTIKIDGAKNAALPIIASTLLAQGNIVLENVPRLLDIDRMNELLRGLGVSVNHGKDTLEISVPESVGSTLDSDIAMHMRASIIATGPVLARCGEVTFSHPGGCVIGARPIDLFLKGYEALGATVTQDDDGYHISAPNGGLKGTDFFFTKQSHTGTETLMMAAVLAEGTTTLKNASVEPEIVDVAHFLNACGASIKGAGTHTITIEGTGGKLLTPPQDPYRVMPDRLEAGSFLLLGALCAKNLTLTNVYSEHLELVLEMLQESGVPIEYNKDTIYIKNNTKPNSSFKAQSIKTHEYPGFPTDLQAPFVIFLTQATGEARVFETIFEGRLGYIDDLVYMGADIEVFDLHRARVRGPQELEGRTLTSPDIRAGLAYIIAALVAEGESRVSNMMYVDRGYEKIEKKLRSLGADVTRITQN